MRPAILGELTQGRQAALHRGAKTTRAHTPLGSSVAAMALRDFLDGSMHRYVARARDSNLPSQQAMRGCGERKLGLPLCAASDDTAQALWTLLTHLLSYLPRTVSCLAKELWVRHGVRCSVVLMSVVVPVKVQDMFAFSGALLRRRKILYGRLCLAWWT